MRPFIMTISIINILFDMRRQLLRIIYLFEKHLIYEKFMLDITLFAQKNILF